VKKKKFTVFCFCCCGCDQNEIHWVEADYPSQAKRKIPNHENKNIIAVIRGCHKEARRKP
jgi:hypothetical protein